MHVSTTWALACAETVQQCPGVARQVETRLLDSRVAYKMTVDHSSRQPVFFPLCTLVDRSCVCPDRASTYTAVVTSVSKQKSKVFPGPYFFIDIIVIII